jgi:hypothetical protein
MLPGGSIRALGAYAFDSKPNKNYGAKSYQLFLNI